LFLALVAVQSCLGQLLPPIDDPLYIDDVELSLDALAPIACGTVSLSSGVVTGLSTLTSSVDISPGGLLRVNVTIEIGVPTVEITGRYTSDILLALKDLVPIIAEDLNVIGAGELLAGLSAGNLTVKANIPYTGTARINSLDIDLGFASASANLEDLTVNGDAIIWEEFNVLLKIIFDKFWGDNKDNITTVILTAANQIINGCTAPELIGIIVGNGTADCLNFPPMPRPTSLLGEMIRPKHAVCPVPNPTTEEPDVSDEPETTFVTEPEPEPTTTPTPSSSVVLKPLYDIMHLFLLIVCANVLHIIN